ncbi:MAG: 4Fe-4S binding protein [Candidatus Bathyarchaeota archaeon]
MPKIQVNLDLCDGCGTCVSICPSSVLKVSGGKARAENPELCLGINAKQLCSICILTEETCTGCVVCVRNCPVAAIEILKI